MTSLRHILSTILFTAAMLVMVIFLTVAGLMICTVKVLKPENLTALVQAYANKALDADVSLGRAELSFRPVFPMLNVELDSLTVVSKAFDDLSAGERGRLPQWTDSLFSLDRFSGTVNLKALLKGEIAVENVEIVRPGLNIVIDSKGRGNFDIYRSTDTIAVDESGPALIPPFSIRKFAFVEPREIRYFNAIDSTDATVVLIRDMSLEDAGRPAYSFRLDGHLEGPLTKDILNLQEVAFGLDGRVRWQPSDPMMLAFEQFRIKGAFVTGELDCSLKYDSTLTVESARVAVDPVKIADILTVVPDSIRVANRLIEPYFSTDGTVTLEASLLSPYCAARDSLPAVEAVLTMPDAALRYGKARFRSVGFDVSARLQSNNPDDAEVNVRRLTVSGPATALDLSGIISHLFSDPVFDAEVKGRMDVQQLPPVVANMADGFIKGILDADFKARGRMSMLSATGFHRLNVKGRLTGHNLYYLSNDTAKMADVRRIDFAFGSQHRMRDSSGVESDPMLAAGIRVDTATILIDGVDIALSNLRLGAGIENRVPTKDTTAVVPVGGAISIDRLNIISVTDSAGARLRNVSGHVSLTRFNGYRHLPQINAQLDIGRLVAGAPNTRFVLSKAHLGAMTYKKPMSDKRRKVMKAMADSILREHPDLAPDSVLKLVRERRLARRGKGPKHLQEGIVDDVDVLEWDLSKGLRKYILGWQLSGTLTTRNARLYTPVFPLRNRVSRLDIGFSNDSVAINGLRYKAGNSDLKITGLISNIRRALTRKSDNSLKFNFEIESDTIDVNQLAAAAFSGAAYLDRLRKGKASHLFSAEGESEDFEKDLDNLGKEHADSTGPLLIPVNIDGEIKARAKNILYSDLMLSDMRGDILLFGGGLNLHNLSASSDAGDVELSALYFAPRVSDMHFGFGLNLDRMNIERFLRLVPAVDSLMPMMRDFSGIIDAEMAATVSVDSSMNLVLPTLDAALKLSGDSLAFINPQTYATIGKWLRFRDRADNKIKHVSVEMVVRDDVLQIFPFSFDIDRYRLGVAGYNDLNLNFNYHISVLKSPLPFKFGITLKGNPDKYKIRLGGAKFKENMAVESIGITDTARVNLMRQIENVFRRGVKTSRFSRLDMTVPHTIDEMRAAPDATFTAEDSAVIAREGLMEMLNDTIISK